MSDAPLPVNEGPASPSIAVSVDGRIVEDRLCIDCGYNLRGLRPDGVCPECGGAVAASLRGLKLEAASLPWLRAVRRGFKWLRHSILLALLSWIVSAIVVGTMSGYFSTTSAPAASAPISEVVLGLVSIGSFLAALALASCGFVYATRAEPRVKLRGEGLWPRRLARVLAATTLVLAVAFWSAKKLIATGTWMDYVVLYMPTALTLVGALAAAAFVEHVIALLERTAEEKTIKGARDTRKYVLAAIILTTAIALIDAVVPLFGPGSDLAYRVEKAGEFVSCVQSCVTILFAIGALQLIWRVAAVMDWIVRVAEEQETSSTPEVRRER
jgi:hypothetical protein